MGSVLVVMVVNRCGMINFVERYIVDVKEIYLCKRFIDKKEYSKN